MLHASLPETAFLGASQMALEDGAWRVSTQRGEVLVVDASALRALPPFPRLGVSLAFLKHFSADFATELHGKTTAEACAQASTQ